MSLQEANAGVPAHSERDRLPASGGSGSRIFASGNYRYAPGVFQYSAGVAALPGFAIERFRFSDPVPLKQAFDRVAAIIQAEGLPLTAFCACELRSPAPFSDKGFAAFNEIYAGTLKQWGLFAQGDNPVARSNVCPEINPPSEPSMHAFCFVRPAKDAVPSFVVAGSAEVPEPEGKHDYGDHAIAAGDTSPSGMRQKAQWVLGEMERRMAALGADWSKTTGVNVYTVYDIHNFIGQEIVARGAARHGLIWHFNRPPIVGLDYEMDCRGVAIERVIAAG